MEPDIGIAKKKREAVADALVQTLSDTYALYQKTHLYHWNVEGPRFGPLHLLFETQYNELWAAIDLIAERVRALGVYAPSHADMAKRTTISSDNDPAPSADAMLKALLSANEAVAKSAKSTIKAAEAADDPATADLMTERTAASEKAAWMLRAHLAE